MAWPFAQEKGSRQTLIPENLRKQAGTPSWYPKSIMLHNPSIFEKSHFGRHNLQSLILTSYFYKNIYQKMIYLYFYESIFQDKSIHMVFVF